MWRSILQDYQERVQEVPEGLRRPVLRVSGEPLPETNKSHPWKMDGLLVGRRSFRLPFGGIQIRPSFSGEDIHSLASLQGFISSLPI